MEKYNIFVISDNQTFAKNFISKILLLRKTDQIGSCGYLDAKNELQNLSPDIVFFHIKDYQDTKKILEFKEIKSLEKKQIELVEQNRKLISDISVLSSSERIEKIAEGELGMRKANTEDIVRVEIKGEN